MGCIHGVVAAANLDFLIAEHFSKENTQDVTRELLGGAVARFYGDREALAIHVEVASGSHL